MRLPARATCAFILELESAAERDQFQATVPLLLQTVGAALNQGDEHTAKVGGGWGGAPAGGGGRCCFAQPAWKRDAHGRWEARGAPTPWPLGLVPHQPRVCVLKATNL